MAFRPPEKLYKEIIELVPDGEKLSRTIIELIEIGLATKKNHGIKNTINLKVMELEKLNQMKKIQDLEFKTSIAAKNAEIEFYKEIQRKKIENEERKIEIKEENEKQEDEKNSKAKERIEARDKTDRENAFVLIEGQPDLKKKLLEKKVCTRETCKNFALEYFRRNNEHGDKIRVNRRYIGEYWKEKHHGH